MSLDQLFFLVAVCAEFVSVFGILDAMITRRVFLNSDRSWDINAAVLARAGVRTAFLRSVQMAGVLVVAEIATRINPRPEVAEALRPAWGVLIGVCVISAVKELLAMWDRRHIVPDLLPPEGWE